MGENVVERLQVLEVEVTCREAVCADYDRVSAHMSSLQLWLHAQDLHKIKPTTTPVWMKALHEGLLAVGC